MSSATRDSSCCARMLRGDVRSGEGAQSRWLDRAALRRASRPRAARSETEAASPLGPTPACSRAWAMSERRTARDGRATVDRWKGGGGPGGGYLRSETMSFATTCCSKDRGENTEWEGVSSTCPNAQIAPCSRRPCQGSSPWPRWVGGDGPREHSCPGSGPPSFFWAGGGLPPGERWTVHIPRLQTTRSSARTRPGRARPALLRLARIARAARMSLDDGVWRLWRDGPDFSERFTGRFSDDGTTISGAWEIAPTAALGARLRPRLHEGGRGRLAAVSRSARACFGAGTPSRRARERVRCLPASCHPSCP